MIAPITAIILAAASLGADSVPALRSSAAPSDTVQPAPVEYSDWYGRRLTIHRWASYATLPLFAFQYAAGEQLYKKSVDAPEWAKRWHGPAATAVAVLFGVNTVTGVWNLWDARKDPEGRKWRTAHAMLMLAADAGFTATGMLAERAERSESARRQHRNIALSSMAVATVSYLMMLPPFRRD
jgi:Na+/H+ antiporter NhaA